MQNQTSPLILTFGVSDPAGALGIQADLATFSAHSCHGLSVTTALLISDTTGVEDVQLVDPDWVSDQARVLLEDMAVQAIKIGALGGLDQISAIAEIVSDYPDVPLILDPFISALPEQGLDDEDMLTAMRQLLVPQATMLLLSQEELERLAETWREPNRVDTLQADVDFLLELGCEYVLVTGAAQLPGAGHLRANTLYGADGVVLHDAWQHLPGHFVGAGSTLSAAITAEMAHNSVLEAIIAGADPDDVDQDAVLTGAQAALPSAVTAAQDYLAGAMAAAQRFGMGKLVPNRFYKPGAGTRR